MSKLFLFLQLFLIPNISAFCVDHSKESWKHLKNAVNIGSDKYINDGNEKSSKWTVYVIKIISCSKNDGEFSISYILNDYQYSEVNASNYFELDNKLILIRTDSLNTVFTEKSGFPIMNDSIKEKALNILAGPNNFITAQPPSVMIFSYKKGKITGKYFGVRFMVSEKYKYYNNKR